MRQRDGHPNGDKYIGAWFNGQKHGLGIFYDSATGDKKQGEWKEGKRVKWLNKPIKVNGENNKILALQMVR